MGGDTGRPTTFRPSPPRSSANQKPSGTPDPSPGRRPRRNRAAVAALALLTCAVLVVVQLHRPPPPPALTVALPAVLTIPGTPPQLPWPASGQAAIDVPGVGGLGTSGGGRPLPIGSVAKVMTAYLVLVHHPLTATSPGPEITVGPADEADYRARAGTGQSLLPVHAGERLTERQALVALLVPSANNIADLLARFDAGTTTGFVAAMNATAARVGMTSTRYTDPSGLSDTTVSTAADQVRLAEQALRLPAFAAIVAMREATLPGAGTLRNYNTLLGSGGVIGVKTGSTARAGGNLVFAARRQIAGRSISIVGAVLGQRVAAPPLVALTDALAVSHRLLDAAARAVGVVTVLPGGARAGLVRSADRPSTSVLTGPPLRLLGWAGLRVELRSRPRPIRAGTGVTSVGTLLATLGNQSAVVPLRLSAPLLGPSLRWRLLRGL